MELLTTLDTQMSAIVLFVLAIATVQIYSDAKEIIAVRRGRQLANATAAKNKTPRITALIEIDDSADSILLLLDHLYSFRYANLEVIILVKPTANKYVNAQLAAYRRSNRVKLLKPVKLTKLTTKETAIRQKATGELIIPLAHDSKLSKNFFDNIAIDSLNTDIDILMPRQYVAAGKTLRSAQQVVQSTWKYIWSRLSAANVVKGLKNGYAYRRDALLRRRSMSTTMHCTISYTTAVTSLPNAPQSLTRSTRHLLPFKADVAPIVITSAIAIFILAFVEEYTKLPLIELLPVGYVAIFAIFMSGIKEYTILEKISHILYAPFSLVMFVTSYAYLACVHLWIIFKNFITAIKRKLTLRRSTL